MNSGCGRGALVNISVFALRLLDVVKSNYIAMYKITSLHFLDSPIMVTVEEEYENRNKFIDELRLGYAT